MRLTSLQVLPLFNHQNDDFNMGRNHCYIVLASERNGCYEAQLVKLYTCKLTVKDKVGRRLKEIGVDISRSYEQDSVLLGKLYERGVLTDLFVPGETIEIDGKEYPTESTEAFISKQTISNIKHNCVYFPLEPTKRE